MDVLLEKSSDRSTFPRWNPKPLPSLCKCGSLFPKKGIKGRTQTIAEYKALSGGPAKIQDQWNYGNNKMSTYTFEVENPVVHPVVRSTRHKEPSDFQFEVKSYRALLNAVASTTSDRIESCEFNSGGYRWIIVIYPNGNRSDNGAEYVSLYLRLVTRPADGNSVNASFKFFIFDKLRETYLTIQDGKERKFNAARLEWGIPQALGVVDFEDERNGLLVNDSCTFGAEVYVIRNTATFARLSLMEAQTSRSYTWAVPRFSLLGNETSSPVFRIEGRGWNLCLHPKGNKTGQDEFLSLYIHLQDGTDLIGGRKLYTRCVLSISDQLTGNKHQKTVGFWFDSDNDHGGFDDFLPLTELHSPQKRYKVDDTVTVEATIIEMLLQTQIS